MSNINLESGDQLSPRSIMIWRIVQTLFWLVGVLILFNLIFFPTTGIHLFWNILIPIAPALLVVAVGVWRNICPMASTALFPRHMGFSKRRTLTIAQAGKLNLIALAALFVIVPLRHAVFDMNGLATALLIISLGLIISPSISVLLISFTSVLYFSMYRSLVSLGTYIPKYFILFIVMVNGIVSLISLFSHY